MTRTLSALAVLISALGAASPAGALPRFAAKMGSECTLCHFSPSGGGMRNRYGSHVFQQTLLPVQWDSEPGPGFSGQLNEWLSLGGDFRVSYLFQKPEKSPIPGEKPNITSTFFLMQADLYAAASFGRHVSLVFDLGAYSGFEAWALFRASSSPSDFDLYLKAGHFMPSFGIREVNHDLFTRGGIGLGATDRDTGLEVTGFAGPFSLSIALVNGTFDDSILDTRGSGDRRSFEKALVSRAALRFSLAEWIHAQLGGSIYLNDNTSAANPLFVPLFSPAQSMLAATGVDELRLDAFFTANLGRFTYLADLVYVRDRFPDTSLSRVRGYVSYQELDVDVLQGWMLGATVEFMDPTVDISGNTTLRVGVATELFANAFVEVRAMARRAISDSAPTGTIDDVAIFAHAFF